jgi:hypothetical protein
MKRSYFTHKMAAAMTTAALSMSSAKSFASGIGFDNTAQNIADSTQSFTRLIALTAYIGGTGLAVAGIFKLKQHVDNPGQVMMKDGLVRLGAGGGLLALPFVMQSMQETISAGDETGVGYDALGGVEKTSLE